MRETRLSGSEGGGARTRSPYPYQSPRPHQGRPRHPDLSAKTGPHGAFNQAHNRLQPKELWERPESFRAPGRTVGVSPTESPSFPSTLSTLCGATQDGSTLRSAATEEGRLLL